MKGTASLVTPGVARLLGVVVVLAVCWGTGSAVADTQTGQGEINFSCTNPTGFEGSYLAPTHCDFSVADPQPGHTYQWWSERCEVFDAAGPSWSFDISGPVSRCVRLLDDDADAGQVVVTVYTADELPGTATWHGPTVLRPGSTFQIVSMTQKVGIAAFHLTMCLPHCGPFTALKRIRQTHIGRYYFTRYGITSPLPLGCTRGCQVRFEASVTSPRAGHSAVFVFQRSVLPARKKHRRKR
jgi:hypothetical protein